MTKILGGESNKIIHPKKIREKRYLSYRENFHWIIIFTVLSENIQKKKLNNRE